MWKRTLYIVLYCPFIHNLNQLSMLKNYSIWDFYKSCYLTRGQWTGVPGREWRRCPCPDLSFPLARSSSSGPPGGQLLQQDNHRNGPPKSRICPPSRVPVSLPVLWILNDLFRIPLRLVSVPDPASFIFSKFGICKRLFKDESTELFCNVKASVSINSTDTT